jgi:conjugal transfer/entry exclusion protein
MLANKAHCVSARVSIGEYVLFLRIETAVEGAHAKSVTEQQAAVHTKQTEQFRALIYSRPRAVTEKCLHSQRSGDHCPRSTMREQPALVKHYTKVAAF